MEVPKSHFFFGLFYNWPSIKSPVSLGHNREADIWPGEESRQLDSHAASGVLSAQDRIAQGELAENQPHGTLNPQPLAVSQLD